MYKLLLAPTLLFSFVATAQSLCNKAVERYIDPADPYHYQSRSGVYCEGTVARKPVSGRDFQVVSILRGPLRFTPNDLIITITAPNFRKSVNLEARTSNHTYRLDSQIAPAGAFNWHLSNVIKPKNFQPSQLYLIGYSGSQENPLYVPLKLTTASFQTAISPIIVSLVANEELENVAWRYAPAPNGIRAKEYSSWISVNNGTSFTAESRIDVRLITKPALESGEYAIDITGHPIDSPDNQKRTESFRLWVD